MKPLTARQQEVYDFLKHHLETTGMPPTRAEISKELGFRSPNAAEEHLKALAKKGGVAHITLYEGFLCKGGTASILDAIAHLEHAIDVMGIDHVGIGTDFDGDGGVCGIANSSEIINFTIQLLRRCFSEQDIEKIWGGNWLRVMEEVQMKR